MKSYLPTAPEVIREVIVVLAGALIATLIVKSLPAENRAFFTFGGNQP